MTDLPAAVALLVLGTAAGPAAAARRPACPAFADPAGDASYKGSPVADPALDLTRVTFSLAGGDLAVRLQLVRLGDNPTSAWGDRYQASFRLGGHVVDAYYKRSRTRDVERLGIEQAGLRVDGVFVEGSDTDVAAAYSQPTGSVTLRVRLSALAAATGVRTSRARLTELAATAYGSMVAVAEESDRATGGRAAFVVAACSAPS